MQKEQLFCGYRHLKKKKNIPSICCFIKSYIVKSSQRKMENTFKGLLLPTPIEAKTVSLNNPREKYPAAIKHLFSNLKVKLFKRMKTADTSPLLSLDSSV